MLRFAYFCGKNERSMEKQLEPIRNKIYEIRGQRVMLDRDLAELYQVTTGNLNKAVKRNMKRFPPDFMFQLTREEFEELRSNLIFQNGISSWGGTRKLPYAFTQAGLAMLSGILNSDIAIDANIKIMRIFVSFYTVPTLSVTSERLSKIESEIQHIKQDMEESLADQNDINESTRAQLDAISEALAELQPREPKPRRRIGFIQEE